MVTLSDELAALATLSPAQLRAEWRRVYRTPPPRLTPDLLLRGVASRLQERAQGGLPTATARELDRMAKRLLRGDPLEPGRENRLKPGTRLLQHWNGSTHSVLVTDDGCMMDDRRFTSLNRDGVTTKASRSREGRTRGGILWARGSLAHLLANRVYIGEVRHRDQHFAGEYSAIIAEEVFTRVQARLAANRIRRTSSSNLQHNNLLRGLLFDGLGRRMQGVQANRGQWRYHCYITNPADIRITPGSSWRRPAADLENTVVQRLQAFLTNPSAIYDAAAAAGLRPGDLAAIIARARDAAISIDVSPATAIPMLHRVDVHDDRVDMTLNIESLLPARDPGDASTLHRISVPMTRIKRGKEVRMLIGDSAAPSTKRADAGLIKLVATARGAWTAMLAAGGSPLADVARFQGYPPEHFTLLLRLSTLAPCIVSAIVEGHQPMTLSRQRLASIKNLPVRWAKQRAMLGFQ